MSKQPKQFHFSSGKKKSQLCRITVESTSKQAILSTRGAVLSTNRQFKGFLKLTKIQKANRLEKKEGKSAHGLFGDDAELAAGVAAAAGELERGVARGHAAAQDDVHERAPHPLSSLDAGHDLLEPSQGGVGDCVASPLSTSTPPLRAPLRSVCVIIFSSR